MQNISDLSPQIKLLFSHFEPVLQAFQQAHERCLKQNEPLDYGKIEHDIAEACRKLECAIHAQLLSLLNIDAERLVIGKVLHRKVQNHDGDYHCQAGDLKVSRTLYRPLSDQNAKTVDIVSLRAGCVGDGWLPETAKAMAFLLQQNPSREAEATGKQLNRLVYSRASFERVTHLVSKQLITNQEEIYETLIEEYIVPKEATSISVSLDRVSLPMEEPRPKPRGRPKRDAPKRPIQRVYHMAYCATVTLHNNEGKALHTLRYGKMPQQDVQALCEGLVGDVRVLKKQKSNLKIILLCDGAKELWGLLENAFSENAPELEIEKLVDFWHMIEKLGAAAKLIFAREMVSEKVSRWASLLKKKWWSSKKIGKELSSSGKEFVSLGESKPVHEAITYLENNVKRMNYAKACEEGLPIGSGNVEATCKSLIEVRMKRCGMRWKEQSGQEIIELRALALSSRWDRGIQLALAPLAQTRIQLARAV
jgi:hypothetical protein